jgi:hypothetical protein
MGRKTIIWGLVLLLSISLSGCGSKSASTNMATQDAIGAYSVASEAKSENGTENVPTEQLKKTDADKPASNGAGTAMNNTMGQKVIFTGQINLQTKDFEKSKTDLFNYINSIGGYTQNSSVNGGGIDYQGLKSGEFVFRIPKTSFSQSMESIKKFGTVVSEQSNGEDITDKYFDTEARLKSLKIQEERLLALLQKATEMEDILKIEKELQATRYEIENYTGTIKKWDSLIDYSTITVNITEVSQIKPGEPTAKSGLLSRIAFGFKNSVMGLWNFTQDFIVFVVAAIPVLIPLALLAYIAYRIYRKNRKRKTSIAVDEKEADKK